MAHKIVSVFDSKVGIYDTPTIFRSRGEALRSWQTVVNDAGTPFSKYPADYSLFEIADFDPEKGIVIPCDPRVNLGSALEFKKVAPTNGELFEVKNAVS